MNAGDNVYYEFELGRIDKIENGKIKSVITEGFLTSGFDLSDNCFPETSDISYISLVFKNSYQEIREAAKQLNLNYPDIHKAFVRLWRNVCIDVLEKNKVPDFTALNIFSNQLLIEIREAIHKKIGITDIRLFRY